MRFSKDRLVETPLSMRLSMRLPAAAISIVVGLFAAVHGQSLEAQDRLSILSEDDIESWESKNGAKGLWKEREFSGRTVYEAVSLDDSPALRATSRGSASVLYREIRVDLEKTPYLHWDWRIEKSIGGVDERTKEGDDYSARVYVVRANSVFFWKTRAVNYVWAGSQAAGEAWPSAYTDASYNVALRSGDTRAGRWVHEWRDVRADFRDLFGEDIRYIDGVAIMTDADNSGGEAVGWYRNVFFGSEPGEAQGE